MLNYILYQKLCLQLEYEPYGSKIIVYSEDIVAILSKTTLKNFGKNQIIHF